MFFVWHIVLTTFQKGQTVIFYSQVDTRGQYFSHPLLKYDRADPLLTWRGRYNRKRGSVVTELLKYHFKGKICQTCPEQIGKETFVGLKLNILEEQSTRLGVKVNLDKTKIIVFREGGLFNSNRKLLL